MTFKVETSPGKAIVAPQSAKPLASETPPPARPLVRDTPGAQIATGNPAPLARSTYAIAAAGIPASQIFARTSYGAIDRLA